jgi:hypothetical protein
MTTEQPRPDPDDESDGDLEAEGARTPSGGQGWPELDPQALKDKQYMKAGGVEGGQVAVTASDGPVGRRGIPSDLFAKLVEQVGHALQNVGNMVAQPLVLDASTTRSMTIVFGDTSIDGAQTELPYPATLNSGLRIAQLISLEGDELFARAVEIGPRMASYVELAKLVQSEGIALDWEVAARTVRLESEKAADQYLRLSEPPEVRHRSLGIDGLLYRVIYEGPGRGRVGIKLSKHSPLPPRRRGHTVVVQYDDKEIEDLVLHQLIGQPVILGVQVAEYAPMTNVFGDPPPHPMIESIKRGTRYEPLELLDDGDLQDELGDD